VAKHAKILRFAAAQLRQASVVVSSVSPPPAVPAYVVPEYSVVARGNDSLGRRGRWQVFAALATASLGLATAFAAAGAWPVLAYSLLELAVLACAFAWWDRHAEDWERLVIAGDSVIVERQAGRKRERREFDRHRLRVDVEPGAGWAGHAPRVVLRGGDAPCEFGHALPAAERLAVARQLRRLTGLRF
jgi:uncharacterized membrane protein